MLTELQSRPELILEVTSYTHRLSGSVEQFQAIARLQDGTSLHINEVWVDGNLRKYAYYQVTPKDDVVQGWDNAPHHPEVSTYPHHHHLAGRVAASSVYSLTNVLDILTAKG